MESKLYLYPRYGKKVKSISGLTRNVNICKMPITLPSCQSSNPKPILDDNTTNLLELLLDNNEKDISSGTSNNGKKKIRSADIDNNKEDIRPIDIDKQKPATPDRTPQNGLLSKSSSIFKEVMFSKSEFSTGTLVLDTRYKHLGS